MFKVWTTRHLIQSSSVCYDFVLFAAFDFHVACAMAAVAAAAVAVVVVDFVNTWRLKLKFPLINRKNVLAEDQCYCYCCLLLQYHHRRRRRRTIGVGVIVIAVLLVAHV